MFMKYIDLDDSALLAEIGRRLKTERLDADMTRDQLAERTGLSPDTVRNAEVGKNVSLESLIRILRGLHRLDRLDGLLAEAGPSPVALARRHGRQRQRASGKRRGRPAGRWRW